MDVLVHVLPRGLRACHLIDDLVARLFDGMLYETLQVRVEAPLFGDALIDDRLVPDTD